MPRLFSSGAPRDAEASYLAAEPASGANSGFDHCAESLKPIGGFQHCVEIENIIVCDRLAALGLVELSGEAPFGDIDTSGEEYVNDMRLSIANLNHPAHWASEEVGRLVGIAASPDLDVTGSQFHVATVCAGCSDECHVGIS
jgi:hypothetical protein